VHECDFETNGCDYDTHECDLDTHAWMLFQHLACDFGTNQLKLT
jgi:hypothetical protein